MGGCARARNDWWNPLGRTSCHGRFPGDIKLPTFRPSSLNYGTFLLFFVTVVFFFGISMKNQTSKTGGKSLPASHLVGGFRYATLYFEADGFHASQIGVLIAVRRALQTLGTPLWNAMADKTKKARMGI